MVCIVSVMLGVATLIVVNSVMSGFSTKLKERLHGLLSDIVIESNDMDGFADPAEKMRRIRSNVFLNDKVEAMAATMEVFAMIMFDVRGPTITLPTGVIVGNAIASYRDRHAHADMEFKDVILLEPGDEVKLITVSGQKLKPVDDLFVVCDYFKSEMSEYDNQYVFVPLDHLQ